jgi:hypothetical protein
VPARKGRDDLGSFRACNKDKGCPHEEAPGTVHLPGGNVYEQGAKKDPDERGTQCHGLAARAHAAEEDVSGDIPDKTCKAREDGKQAKGTGEFPEQVCIRYGAWYISSAEQSRCDHYASSQRTGTGSSTNKNPVTSFKGFYMFQKV